MPPADAKSGKKKLQYKEVLSHSLSKGSCLLFAKLSKVVKENVLSGFGVGDTGAKWHSTDGIYYLHPNGN